ncbi:RTA1 like protein-domain-containing protein [Truncatella angustata]|uniref:RTA1 like protein-domain-containing protein n=1 Tax=Truncatella angustata TaxID=152316 RepID=A0A9P8UUW0_9PEZI|nr:RTA1 like protein-domain-containing protein [Truncatella angustata]KAH6658658.1 RTA1 like protein-domain-containing protein [Truncatella angustata]
MAVLETTKGGYYLWNYLPSVPAAVIFLLLFLVMTSLISWRMFKTKTWFCIPLVIGGFFEFAGYCARASAHNKTGKIMPYAVQNFYILLGPTLFAASIYMCLGRIIRGVRADHHSLIQPRKLTRTFVTGDVLSLVVQGGAAGLMVTGKNASLGEGIVIAGLLIQIIMFGVFAATATVFQKRINRNPTPESGMAGAPWKKSMRMLFIVSSLIMIRSLFRVVEFAMGNSGYPLKHEWTLYVFDSVLMVTVMVVYHLWYPTWIVEGKPDVEAYGI